MKTQLALIFLLSFSTLHLFGQNREESKYEFAREEFRLKYKRQEIEKYKRTIEVIDSGTVKFGTRVIKIDAEKGYRNIFEKGIFNPDVIFGKETTKSLAKSELDTLSAERRVLYNMIRNDSLGICCIEQLEKLNPDHKTKRFKFWLSRTGIANPTECYFELFNESASPAASFEDFLESAVMTFFLQGTVII